MNESRFVISYHASIRMTERRITLQMVEDTIAHGELIRKQGLLFFIMTRKTVKRLFSGNYAEKVVDTVVVMDWDDTVKTVYQNSKALRNIRKKSKRLGVNICEKFTQSNRKSRTNQRMRSNQKCFKLTVTSYVQERMEDLGLTLQDLDFAISNSRHVNLPGGIVGYLVRGTSEMYEQKSVVKSMFKGLKLIRSNDGKVISLQYDHKLKTRREDGAISLNLEAA